MRPTFGFQRTSATMPARSLCAAETTDAGGLAPAPKSRSASTQQGQSLELRAGSFGYLSFSWAPLRALSLCKYVSRPWPGTQVPLLLPAVARNMSRAQGPMMNHNTRLPFLI